MKIISTVVVVLAAVVPALAFAQDAPITHSTPAIKALCVAQTPGLDHWLKQPSPGALGQGVYTHH